MLEVATVIDREYVIGQDADDSLRTIRFRNLEAHDERTSSSPAHTLVLPTEIVFCSFQYFLLAI
jgi:hypothetical protein